MARYNDKRKRILANESKAVEYLYHEKTNALAWTCHENVR